MPIWINFILICISVLIVVGILLLLRNIIYYFKEFKRSPDYDNYTDETLHKIKQRIILQIIVSIILILVEIILIIYFVKTYFPFL